MEYQTGEDIREAIRSSTTSLADMQVAIAYLRENVEKHKYDKLLGEAIDEALEVADG